MAVPSTVNTGWSRITTTEFLKHPIFSIALKLKLAVSVPQGPSQGSWHFRGLSSKFSNSASDFWDCHDHPFTLRPGPTWALSLFLPFWTFSNYLAYMWSHQMSWGLKICIYRIVPGSRDWYLVLAEWLSKQITPTDQHRSSLTGSHKVDSPE